LHTNKIMWFVYFNVFERQKPSRNSNIWSNDWLGDIANSIKKANVCLIINAEKTLTLLKYYDYDVIQIPVINY